MNKERLIKVLKNKYEVTSNEGIQLENIVKNYPYFQAARISHLKSLQYIKSYRFNEALKVTAAYTYDRSLLFDFISTEQPIEKQNEEVKTSTNKQTNPAVNEDKTNIDKEILQFGKSDFFSFNQWLQLSHTHGNKVFIQPLKNKSNLDKKIDLINDFIKKSPSISKIDKNDSKPQKKHKLRDYQKEVMTETLAKVYLAQNKYDNAIEAYEILILKYPEKSAFFADQIKKIKSLKK